ncbi:RLA class II histocompatibility antigen, DP alpha-1 chain-like [Sebastes fasciatus]|uniref:RLA class II histocompatibility antigen, DP alpha-1 chain-like n=1 Tax=Sebastes fasciatus TaxID=394691 RepID=UPI003D9E0C3A
MKICSSDRMLSALVVILTINSFCAFSQSKIPHEICVIVGCFYNGTTQVQYEFDAEEILYMDFDREELVYTVPRFMTDDPSKLFENINVFINAEKNKNACLAVNNVLKSEERNLTEETDAPESILYPSEEVKLGVENTLICFVNHFYSKKWW